MKRFFLACICIPVFGGPSVAQDEGQLLEVIRSKSGLLGQLKHSYEWSRTFNTSKAASAKAAYDQCRLESSELKLRYLTGVKTELTKDPRRVAAQADELEALVGKIIREEQERRRKELAEFMERQALHMKLDEISRQLEELRFIRGR